MVWMENKELERHLRLQRQGSVREEPGLPSAVRRRIAGGGLRVRLGARLRGVRHGDRHPTTLGPFGCDCPPSAKRGNSVSASTCSARSGAAGGHREVLPGEHAYELPGDRWAAGTRSSTNPDAFMGSVVNRHVPARRSCARTTSQTGVYELYRRRARSPQDLADDHIALLQLHHAEPVQRHPRLQRGHRRHVPEQARAADPSKAARDRSKGPRRSSSCGDEDTPDPANIVIGPVRHGQETVVDHDGQPLRRASRDRGCSVCLCREWRRMPEAADLRPAFGMLGKIIDVDTAAAAPP